MADDVSEANPGDTELSPAGSGGRRLGAIRSRKGVAITVSAIIVVAALASVVIFSQSEKTVTIVAILADEGTYSHSDEIEMSLQMVVDDVNRWTGIGGAKVELVFERTGVDTESITETLMAAERDHHPLLYVTAGCEFLGVLGPLADEIQAPLLGMGSTPGLTEGLDWVYRFTIPASSESDSAMRLFKLLDLNSVGVLYHQDPHSCGIYTALIDSMSDSGESVEAQGFEAADELPAKISNLTDNEAILCIGSCSELAYMLPAVDESDFDGYIMTSSCGSTPILWNMLEEREVYVSAPLIYKPENVNARDYVLRFESTYNISATHHGAVAHDMLDLAQGLLTGFDPTRENLRQELDKGFVLSGVVGIIRVDPGVHDFAFDVYPAVISEGELRYL